MVQAVEGEWWEGGVKEGGRGKVVQTWWAWERWGQGRRVGKDGLRIGDRGREGWEKWIKDRRRRGVGGRRWHTPWVHGRGEERGIYRDETRMRGMSQVGVGRLNIESEIKLMRSCNWILSMIFNYSYINTSAACNPPLPPIQVQRLVGPDSPPVRVHLRRGRPTTRRTSGRSSRMSSSSTRRRKRRSRRAGKGEGPSGLGQAGRWFTRQ